MIKQSISLILCSLLSLLLLACGSAEKRTSNDSATPSQNVEQLLQLANNANNEQRPILLLKATALLIERQKLEKALEVLTFIEVNQLKEIDKDSYYLNYGEILLASKEPESQNSSLTQFNKIIKPSSHSIKWQVRYGKSVSDSYLINNNYYEAA